MDTSIVFGLKLLLVPPNYVRRDERQHIRDMNGPITRPAGDHRSADMIIEQSLILEGFYRSNAHVFDDHLKEQVGDWTHRNQDPEARADAAFTLEKVLRFIDHYGNSETRWNAQIDGFTKWEYFDVAPQSEASVLEQFAYHGWDVLHALGT
ncbi:hypothetical protein LRS56_12860 [Pseudomonas poae]|nr:hypothetical protein LRS56_12860 [Pseudomonas poae]